MIPASCMCVVKWQLCLDAVTRNQLQSVSLHYLWWSLDCWPQLLGHVRKLAEFFDANHENDWLAEPRCCHLLLPSSMCCNKIDTSSMILLRTWASIMRHHAPRNIYLINSLSRPAHSHSSSPGPCSVAVEEQPWMNLLKPTWSISQASLPPLPLVGHSPSWGWLLDIRWTGEEEKEYKKEDKECVSKQVNKESR